MASEGAVRVAKTFDKMVDLLLKHVGVVSTKKSLKSDREASLSFRRRLAEFIDEECTPKK